MRHIKIYYVPVAINIRNSPDRAPSDSGAFQCADQKLGVFSGYSKNFIEDRRLVLAARMVGA